MTPAPAVSDLDGRFGSAAAPELVRPGRRTSLLPLQRGVVLAIVLVMTGCFTALVLVAPAELSLLNSALLAAVLILLIAPFLQRSPDLFHPAILVSLTVSASLVRRAPLLTGPSEFLGLSDSQIRTGVIRLLICHVLALAATYAGCAFAKRRRWSIRFMQGPIRSASEHKTRLVLVIVGAFVLSLLLAEFTAGGVVERIASATGAGGRRKAFGGQHYFIIWVSAGTYACFIWFASHARMKLTPPLAIAIAVAAFSVFLANGSRGQIIIMLVTLMALKTAGMGRVPVMMGVVVVVLMAYALAGLGGLEETFRGGDDIGSARAPGVTAALEEARSELASRSAKYDGPMAIVSSVPEAVPHVWGETYLAPLTLPIPRGLWPGKPGLVGGRVGDTFFNAGGGVPAGGIGEAYWNFGYPGVVVVYFAWGGLLMAAYRGLIVSRPGDAVALVAYILVFLGLRSPSTTDAVACALTLIVFIAVVRFCGRLAPADIAQGRR